MPNYNPMSYHNGSIWPHDNSLIAAGFYGYGLDEAGASVLDALLAAALADPDYRLPELYCGFPRRNEPNDRPVSYPVSCSPQAWAAGAHGDRVPRRHDLEFPRAVRNRSHQACLCDANQRRRGLHLGQARYVDAVAIVQMGHQQDLTVVKGGLQLDRGWKRLHANRLAPWRQLFLARCKNRQAGEGKDCEGSSAKAAMHRSFPLWVHSVEEAPLSDRPG